MNVKDCIKHCQDCSVICRETISHCLTLGGEHARAEHIRLLMDCAQICQVSADFMIRGSTLHALTCRACAEVCRQCADDCRKLDGAEMKRCADECDRCATSCEEMVTSMGYGRGRPAQSGVQPTM